MSTSRTSGSRDAGPGDRDPGASLVEIVVSVLIIGLIATALSSTITTLLRTTERVNAIVDESNGQLTLLTTFERDAGLTPAAGVELGQGAEGCTGADPGSNIVQFNWDDGVIVRRAAYRLVVDGTDAWIERRSCRGSPGYLVLEHTAVVARSLDVPPAGWSGTGPPVIVNITDNVIRMVLVQSIGTTTLSATLQTNLGVMT